MPTFDASIPLSSDSPALFPSQSQDNFSVLNTIISRDHQFNNTPSGGDNSGYHNLVHMIPQTIPTLIAGIGQFYTKDVSGVVQLFFMDSAGVEYQITPISSSSSLTYKGSATLTGTPTVILPTATVPSYTGILTVVKAGSSDGFKTFTLYKDVFGDNSSRINSSGSSFDCIVSFSAGGDLRIEGSGSTSVFWTLNLVKY